MLAMLCFAGMDASSKWLVADYPVGEMMWVRSALYFLFAWFVARKQGLRAALGTRRPGLQILRSLVVVIESAIFVLAVRYLPLADTHALAGTSPLLVVVLGALFLGERGNLARWLAVALGFAGLLLIVRPGLKDFGWPLLLPLGGALLWAVYQLLTRLAQRHDSADTSLVWSALVALVATSFVGPIGWRWPSPAAWSLLVFIAVLNAIAHYALIKALDHAEAGAVQPYAYTSLVWVTILGLVVFGDFPDGWTIAGAAVIVTGSLIAWRQERRSSTAT